MGKRLSSVFSPDMTLISASAAPHCGVKHAKLYSVYYRLLKDNKFGSLQSVPYFWVSLNSVWNGTGRRLGGSGEGGEDGRGWGVALHRWYQIVYGHISTRPRSGLSRSCTSVFSSCWSETQTGLLNEQDSDFMSIHKISSALAVVKTPRTHRKLITITWRGRTTRATVASFKR